MNIVATIVMLAALAYVAGATPFGYLAGRARGIDIRQHGSGNIGATNVIRVLGKALGIPVFVLDFLKGFVPVFAAGWWCHRQPAFADAEPFVSIAEVVTGLAAVLGHNYTFWLGFRGGKGIATSAGVLFGLAPWVLLAAIAVWVATYFVSGYVSAASIAAGVVLPIAASVQGVFRGAQNWPLVILCAVIGALAVWRHRTNLARLRAGTEPRRGDPREGGHP
jgi:glycerol-3-phosphate acyltransferase PlsY